MQLTYIKKTAVEFKEHDIFMYGIDRYKVLEVTATDTKVTLRSYALDKEAAELVQEVFPTTELDFEKFISFLP